jgi:hypothetical protein
VSCSAQYLNFLATGSPGGNATIDFVDNRPQGALFDPLVIMVGGGPQQESNAEYRLPGGVSNNVDNAYGANGQGSFSEYGTHLNAGEIVGNNPPIDPTQTVFNEITGPVSSQTAWDIGLADLISALTTPAGRHDLYVMFDNNQQGENVGQNILVWALVCVQDAQGVLTDQCFELIDQNGIGDPTANPDPTAFNTAKTYGTAPAPTDFVLANGAFCVDDVTQQVVSFNQSNCPAGQTRINNNLGTNDTEFIVQIPELNDSLEALLALGYDFVSTQLRFTNQNAGFEDVYILAGPVTLVPEPGTLLLIGIALIGFTVSARRRKRN